MKYLVGLGLAVWLGLVGSTAQAGYSALYAFGDGACSTTDGPGGTLYYGSSYCNGRVWIEVLTQRQGLTYDASKNKSWYGHYSGDLASDVSGFSDPNASNVLFVIWVCDADFVDVMPTLNLSTWNNVINACISRHQSAISGLYAKGVRTLVMPNAVDLGEIPEYGGLSAGDKSFVRGRITSFNSSFATMISQARVANPGLTIYAPDFFSLLDDIVAHPGNYGLSHPTVDALSDQDLTDYSLNGPGAGYVFWDPTDPTAKSHAVMGDMVQQLIAPPRGASLTVTGSTNRLQMINVPVGRNGFIEGRTNLTLGSWVTVTNFNSTTVTQTVTFSSPASNPQRFYRLRFPSFFWSWP